MELVILLCVCARLPCFCPIRGESLLSPLVTGLILLLSLQPISHRLRTAPMPTCPRTPSRGASTTPLPMTLQSVSNPEALETVCTFQEATAKLLRATEKYSNFYNSDHFSGINLLVVKDTIFNMPFII